MLHEIMMQIAQQQCNNVNARHKLVPTVSGPCGVIHRWRLAPPMMRRQQREGVISSFHVPMHEAFNEGITQTYLYCLYPYCAPYNGSIYLYRYPNIYLAGSCLVLLRKCPAYEISTIRIVCPKMVGSQIVGSSE